MDYRLQRGDPAEIQQLQVAFSESVAMDNTLPGTSYYSADAAGYRTATARPYPETGACSEIA